jgi:uncharacterized protein YdeI (YjbR/CyaY-like superfamily)
MTTKDEYVAMMQAKLDEWNAHIDELEARARKEKARAAQLRHERVAELTRKRNEVQTQLQKIRQASEDGWESLKAGVETVWKDVTTTFQESKDAFFEGLEKDK